MTAADDRIARGASRWPEHLSLHTEPVDRRRVTPPTSQRLPARAPQRTPQRSAQPLPPRGPQYGTRTPQQRPQPQVRQAPTQQRAGSVGLTGPQLRRRWLGALSAVVLAGGALPVQLGAIGIEALEILSPGRDGGTAVIAAAMAAQVLALLLPMLAAPAIGGFTRRWRARFIVLSANAVVVAAIAAIGWLKVGQA